VAQSKEAQRLTLWVNQPPTTPSFHSPARQQVGWRAGPWKEGSNFCFITPDGASLVRGYSLGVPPGLRIGSLRSQVAEGLGRASAAVKSLTPASPTRSRK